MNAKPFSEVANKVTARIERVARYEEVVTEILSRVLGDEEIPTPCIEVDTDAKRHRKPAKWSYLLLYSRTLRTREELT